MQPSDAWRRTGHPVRTCVRHNRELCAVLGGMRAHGRALLKRRSAIFRPCSDGSRSVGAGGIRNGCVHTCNRHTGNRHPASDALVASRLPAPRRRSCPQHSRIEPRQALRRSVRPARAPSTFAGKYKKGAESTRGRAGRRGARRGQGGRWTPDSNTYQ